MIDNVEMLNYIRQNAEMGIHGITKVLQRTQDEKLRKVLKDQRAEYGSIYGAADKLIRDYGKKPVHADRLSLKSAEFTASSKMKKDPSAANAAQMMIQGNTTGAVKLMKKMADYKGDDWQVSQLADRLLDTQQSNMEQIKDFLKQA